MRLLLDTHVVIWLVEQPEKIVSRVAELIKDNSNDVFISAATPWEIAIKVRLGKLRFDAAFLADFDSRIRRLAFQPLPMTSAHGVAAAQLPGRHKDPFDRMIAAQAATNQLAQILCPPSERLFECSFARLSGPENKAIRPSSPILATFD